MKWLFDRLRGTRRSQTAIVCYLRENGPIAYELAIFGENSRERVEAMFETGLSWYWSTGQSGGPAEWIELTRWSMGALLADLAPSPPARHVLIAGIDPQDARADLARDLAEWGRRFATDDRSPLHVLIQHVPANPAHVFVAQHPPEHVLALLQAWGIDRARATRRAYPRLRDRTLETILDKLRGQQT